jgi:hypothetical protein
VVDGGAPGRSRRLTCQEEELLTGAEDKEIQRLVGVYDADGTVRGELAYLIGARLGRAHCALCDITHGLVRERQEWKDGRGALPVPFVTYHRDDQPERVRAAVGAAAPVVVAETGTGVVGLLGPAELEACEASVERLVAAIERAVHAAGLGWRRSP